jgi:hypothetical protein
MRREPGEFSVRAYETTIFRRSNLARLNYLAPEWSTPRVIAAQMERSFGVFNRFPDANFFWPVDRPAATAALSAAFFMGLVAAIWNLRDLRLFIVLSWFATGFAGIVFTVETPALQRLACSVSAVPLIAALAVDEIRRRFASAGGARRTAVAVIAAAAVAAIAAREGQLFFIREGGRNLWPHPNMEGRAIAAQGRDVWAFSVGDMFHMVLSGWVELLAHETPRRGIRSPGSYLPLPLEPDRDLAFVLYPRQFFFLPYLRDLYPGGDVRPFALDPETPVVTVYHLPVTAWRATRGVVRRDREGRTETVSAFGELSPPRPGPIRWSARVRFARSWNYVFVTAGGRLTVDGRAPERLPGGERETTSILFVPRGDHAVRLDSAAGTEGAHPLLLLGEADPGDTREAWRAAARPLPFSVLEATEAPARGLLGRFDFQDRPPILRLDSAIASGGFNEEVGYHQPYRAQWTGSIRIARGGRYVFRFFVNGVTVDLAVANAVLHVDGLDEQSVTREADLEAGVHQVTLTMNVARDPGTLEWAWRPPGGEESIVPPAVLQPPSGAGSGPPRPAAELGEKSGQPLDLDPQARH